MASNDGNQLRNLIFQDLTSKVKHLDTLCSTLKKMQKGEIQLEPSITLNRILEEVKVAEKDMSTYLHGLKEQNENMEKTIRMVKAVTVARREQLQKVASVMKDYTCSQENVDAPETLANLQGLNLASAPVTESTSSSAVGGGSQDSLSKQVSAPPSTTEVVHNQPGTPSHTSSHSVPVTPTRTESRVTVNIKTPKLTDFLPLESMYSMLDKDNLITKASKRSSQKKPQPQTPKSVSKQVRKSIFPTSSQEAEKTISTPTLPKIKPLKPSEYRMNRPDYSDRIARISADDYHHHVEDKIHKLISLDLINQIVYRVDLLFKLNPGVALDKADLLELITPMAGIKSQLCLSILTKLKRLKSAPDGQLLPVYGSINI